MLEQSVAEAKVMRGIAAREARHAAAERRAAREEWEAAHRPTPRPRKVALTPEQAKALGEEPVYLKKLDARERQRVEHLVLGRDRPPATSVGRGKAKRKAPAQLDASVDAALRLREVYGAKQGTPETRARAANTRQGSLARLHQSGAITSEQLGSAVEIATVHERIGADVSVRTASLETRVDAGGRGDGAFWEALGQVRRELAYTRWRQALRNSAAPVLDMVAGDEGLAAVAKRYRMHHRRARALLVEALDLWPRMIGDAAREVDAATLAAAHAGILG